MTPPSLGIWDASDHVLWIAQPHTTTRSSWEHGQVSCLGGLCVPGPAACPESVASACHSLRNVAADAPLRVVTGELLRNPRHGRIEARKANRTVQVPGGERTGQPRQQAERSGSTLIGLQPEV